MTVRLADVGTWRSGGTPPKDRDELWGGGFPWISTRDLKRPELRDSTDTITEVAANRYSTVVPAGSILIGTRGMALAKRLPVAMVTRGVAFNQDIKAIEPHHGISSKYLLYALLAFEGPILALTDEAAHGTKRLDTGLLRSFRIPCPSLVSQQRIAGLLDVETERIDALISLRERQRAVVLERAASQVDSRIREISAPMVRLRNVLPRIGVGVVVDPSAYFTESGVPFLRGSDVREGWIDTKSTRFLSPDDNARLPSSRLRSGDIVMVRAGYPGRTAVVPPELDGCNCASMLVLRQSRMVNSWFLEAVLNSPVGARQVQAARYGAAQEQINVSDVVGFRVPLPTLAAQECFVSEYRHLRAAVFSATYAIHRQIDLLRERRQALITAAVTGNLHVPDTPTQNATA